MGQIQTLPDLALHRWDNPQLEPASGLLTMVTSYKEINNVAARTTMPTPTAKDFMQRPLFKTPHSREVGLQGLSSVSNKPHRPDVKMGP